MRGPEYEALLEQAKQRMSQRLKAGEANVVESMLQEVPELSRDENAAVELIYAEYVALDSLGCRPSMDQYVTRFPQWRERLERIFQIDEALGVDPLGNSETNEIAANIPGYRLLHRLGNGSMGCVYLAEQLSVRRRVALKVLHPFIRTDRSVVERFHREAVTLGMLSHPNIAFVYASGVENGIHFLAMEYCQGESLQAILDQQPGEMTLGGDSAEFSQWTSFVLQTTIRACEALRYAHENGILHRDVKPSNIIVNRDSDDVWVVDFGLAKVLKSEEETLTHGPLGTPAYSSPEQFAGGSVDARSDVYSLGLTLRRMLSRRPEGVQPVEWLPGVADSVKQVVARATEEAPELRYANAEAFRRDLIAVADGGQPESRGAVAARRMALRLRRHRVQAILMAGMIATVVILGSLFFRERSRTLTSYYQQQIETAVVKLHLAALLSLVDDNDQQFVDFFRAARILDHRSNDDLRERPLLDLNRAISLLPGRPEAHYFRGRTLEALRRTTEAAAALERAQECDTEFVPVRSLQSQSAPAASGATMRNNADSQDWTSHWTAATSARAENRFRDASEAFHLLLDFHQPEPFIGCFVDAKLVRIEALFRTDQYAAAIEQLASLRAQRPLLELGLLIGKAYLCNGDSARAESVLKELHGSATHPDMAAIWSSVIYFNEHRFEEAHQWLRRIKDEYTRDLLSVCMLNLREDAHNAERLAREALEHYPNRAPLHQQLSEILLRQERYEEATEAATQAALLDATFPNAYLQLGAGLIHLGQIDEAQLAFDKAIRFARTPKTHVYVGNQYLQTRHFERAEQCFLDALRLDDRSAVAHFFLGATAEEAGDVTGSLKHYRMAAQLAPRFAYYHQRLANACASVNRWCEALDAYVAAFELNPMQPEVVKQLLFALTNDRSGRSCGDTNRFHDACGAGHRLVEVLQRTVSSREDAESMILLGLAYSCTRSHVDFGKAIATGQRALELSDHGLPNLTVPFLRLMNNVNRHTADPITPRLHNLEYLSSLPPFVAIDALLEHDFCEEPERLVRRFFAVSHDRESVMRLTYLKGRLQQLAGREAAAAKLFWSVIDEGFVEPRPVAHLSHCLRATGDTAAAQILFDRVEAESGGQTRSVVLHWDFQGDLNCATGENPLQAKAASPATSPAFSFERVRIQGEEAWAAHFSRGTFFDADLDGKGDTSGGFTLVLDVCLSLESNAYGALLQTSANNVDDADWAVHPQRGIGDSRIYGGTIKPNQWYRLSLVVDPRTASYSSFVDGDWVQHRTLDKTELDKWCRQDFAMLLFADENQETTSGWVSCVQVRHQALSPLQIALLGRPSASGIPLPRSD